LDDPAYTPPRTHGIRRFVEIVLDVCPVLTYMHYQLERGHPHAHRDISPSNIMVSETRTGLYASLIDFGNSTLYSILTSEQFGLGEGTPGYQAPEQTPQRLPGTFPGPSSDVYALGAVLYHALTGRQVPERFPQREVRGDAAYAFSPRAINAHVPTLLDQIVMRALLLRYEGEGNVRPDIKMLRDGLERARKEMDRARHTDG